MAFSLFSDYPSTNKDRLCQGDIVGGRVSEINMLQPMIQWSHERFRDTFEGGGISDNVDLALVIAGWYEKDLPLALIRTFVYDVINMFDDLANKYRGYVGKAKEYTCEKPQDLLRGLFGETDSFGSD